MWTNKNVFVESQFPKVTWKGWHRHKLTKPQYTNLTIMEAYKTISIVDPLTNKVFDKGSYILYCRKIVNTVDYVL